MEVIWGEVVGFPDYAVSNYGDVCNLRFDTMLKPRQNSYGYMKVALRRDGETYERLVHQLVAQTFMGGWYEGCAVIHDDRDNSNNFVENLIIRGELANIGDMRARRQEISFRRLRVCETGQTFRTVDAAAQYLRCDRSSIYKVLRGERDTHLGYTFEFIEECA